MDPSVCTCDAQALQLEIVGKCARYQYDNGWRYEVLYAAPTRLEYVVHDGPFRGRTAYQTCSMEEVAPRVFMVSWLEETGTVVSTVVNLNTMRLTGSIAFPRYIFDDPSVQRGRKDDRMPFIREAKAKGPDGPREFIFESAVIRELVDMDTALYR